MARKKTCRDLWVVVVSQLGCLPWYCLGEDIPTASTPNLNYAALFTEIQARSILVKLPEDRPGKMVRLDIAIRNDMTGKGRHSFTGVY